MPRGVHLHREGLTQTGIGPSDPEPGGQVPDGAANTAGKFVVWLVQMRRAGARVARMALLHARMARGALGIPSGF